MDKDGDPGCAVYNYSSVVGMLQYLWAHSRPDIAFAVSQVSHFIHNPKHSHNLALEQIGQYLKLNNGLVLKPSIEFRLAVYVDSEFAGLWGVEDKQDLTSAKSHTWFANLHIQLCGNLV